MSTDWAPKDYVRMTALCVVAIVVFILAIVLICEAYGARNLVHQQQIDNKYVQACQPLTGDQRIVCLGQYFGYGADE
jgi:hypothetical protein